MSEPVLALPSLSVARIEAALTAEHITFAADPEGDLATRWSEGFVLYAMPRGEHGEILCVTVYLDQRVGAGEIRQAAEFCNRWNAESLWPKAYVRPVGAAEAAGDAPAADPEYGLVMAELNVDLEFGVSDEQLRGLLVSAISGSAELTKAFDAWFRGR